jgi:hypothetical protein
MKMQARPVEALGRFTTVHKNALGVALGTHGTAFDHEPRERFAGLSFFIYRDEHREVLVCVADKLFHTAAAPPFQSFAGSLRETALQRFHSIIIGRYSEA